MTYMLAIQNNIVQDVNVIDIHAPCIVGTTDWNDVSNMEQHCRDNVILFNQRVLSISDEAFLLLVLYNDSANWMSKIVIGNSKVRSRMCCMCDIVLSYPGI